MENETTWSANAFAESAACVGDFRRTTIETLPVSTGTVALTALFSVAAGMPTIRSTVRAVSGASTNATNFGASTRTVSAPAAVPTRGEIETIALPSYSDGSFWMYRSAPTKMQRAMTAAGFHRQRSASTRSGNPPDPSAKTLLSRSL